MAALGMQAEARDALRFYLDAEAGRFQGWSELASYGMPPYQISLVRYHGFGVEETDFNDFGPNLEFDGFGLFLWALRPSTRCSTGDTGLGRRALGTPRRRRSRTPWSRSSIRTRVLVRKDSSIWETHWKGRERSFAYTSITAARGLCDAAAIAERRGEADRAAGVPRAQRAAARRDRRAAHGRLGRARRERGGARGRARATGTRRCSRGSRWACSIRRAIAARHARRARRAPARRPRAPGGRGTTIAPITPARTDLSPWGSEYDSAEWVVTDLRGAVAARLMGDVARSDRLLRWVLDQSAANYLAVAETYDEIRGTYSQRARMVGFGAGVYALALAARDGPGRRPGLRRVLRGERRERQRRRRRPSSSGAAGTGAGGTGAAARPGAGAGRRRW